MASVQETPANKSSTSTMDAARVTLRRHGGDTSHDLGPGAKDLLKTLELTMGDNRSHALIMWPQSVQGLSVVHALAALSRLSTCDTHRLTTILFPWNRLTGGTQKAL